MVTIDKELEFKYYRDNYYMRNIKPYKTAYNGLSLFSKSICSNIKCEKVVINDRNIEIYIDNTLIKKDLGDIYLRLKRRIHRFLNSFDEIIDLKLEENRAIILNDMFYKKNLLPGDVYECAIVIFKGKKCEYEIPLIANNIQGNYIKSTNYLKYKIFSNSKNILSLFFVGNKTINVESVSTNDNKLTLSLSEKIDDDVISLKIITYKNNSYLKYGYSIENFEYLKDENKLNIDFAELSTLIKRFDNQKFILNCLINNNKNNYSEEINLQFNFKIGEQVIKDENYDLRVVKGGSNECVFILELKDIAPKVKIAVLGSCYSRLAFTSSNFYNPRYKEKYEIVHTHFHSCLISVMTNKKKCFEERYFEHLNSRNKEYVKADFEKTFFESLKNSKAEYLIIDVYADAQKGVIIFPDGSIITGNVNVESSHLMFNLEEGTEMITSKEIKKYIPLWIDAAQRFSKEIVKYIDEKKIIINYTNATESYIDSENNKKSYDNQIDYIRLSNLIMDWMNDYLSYLLPNAKKIDSRSLNYIGLENHPVGNTPNHYESGYYKDFMKLVDSVVLGK